MPRPLTRLLATAATALLAMAGLDARAADLRGERYAMIDPAAMQRATPATPASAKAPVARKKAKAGKAKILTGMQSYRTPAQRALDRINRPAAFPDGLAKSQAWRYATPLAPRAPGARPDEPAGTDSGLPGLDRPFADVPALRPGRESSYKFSYHMPIGQNENVVLQARVRRNAYNTDDTSDSTLRADWSLRF